MNNKLIIAAVGAGKTTHIINSAYGIRNGNVLILTYTIANCEEIKRCFRQQKNHIPSNITIQTWFAFLLEHGVRPYQDTLKESLHCKHLGFQLVNEASGIKYRTHNYPVYYSEEDDFDKHYFTSDFKIYSDKISKFIFTSNKESGNKVLQRLKEIFQYIFIDEVQDLSGHDLELIKLFCKNIDNVQLVGDPRQVAYLTHHEKIHGKYSNGKIKDFILQKFGTRIPCEIDESSLNTSHRNNKEICDFSSLLYPQFQQTQPCSCPGCHEDNQHTGIYFINSNKIEDYILEYKPMQLTWSISTKCSSVVPRMNFGESKGLSFNHVLIYPTKGMLQWLYDKTSKLKDEPRAKLYIAITRARYSVAFVI